MESMTYLYLCTKAERRGLTKGNPLRQTAKGVRLRSVP